MQAGNEQSGPVAAKAVLIEPSTMTVVWMNESAVQDMPAGAGATGERLPLAEAVPIAETLGIPDALDAVARTGVAQHPHTGLVSTSRGSVEIVASIYRLPDGMVLLLMEHGWQVKERRSAESGSRRSGRRKR